LNRFFPDLSFMPGPKIPVIYNPFARSEQARSKENQIRSLSTRIELHPTTSPDSARALAFQLAKDMSGSTCVVAAGGDGTVNEVANGLHQANHLRIREGKAPVPLGILPVGTMNVLSWELGLPRDLDGAWERIECGIPKNVDFWRANNHGFLQLAGVGFDASVIRNTSWKEKKEMGPLSYILSAFDLLDYPVQTIKVTVPGRETLFGSLVLLGNGRHYGGPFVLFPEARMNDGLLDVLILTHMETGDLLRFFSGIARGQLPDDRGIITFRAAEVMIDANPPAPFEVDGELSPDDTPVRFHLDPLAFSVIS
jgi:diacylglycerol kinase (ATP)